MQWIILILAISFEVLGTTLLKISTHQHKMPLIVGSLISYGISICLLSLALKNIEVGIAYAIWSGIGIIFVSYIGILFFSESISFLKLLFTFLILIGAIGLNFISRSS